MSIAESAPSVEDDIRRYTTGAPLGSLAVGAVCTLELAADEVRRSEDLGIAFEDMRRRTEFPFNVPGVLERYWQVAEQLKPLLHNVDLVIGDEISAILPAVCFQRLVDIYRQRQSLPPSALRFINGRYSGRIPEGFIPPSSDSKSKTLIVTDFISHGDSVQNLRRAVLEDRTGEHIVLTAFYARRWRPVRLPNVTYIEPSLRDRGEGFILKYMYGSRLRELLGRKKENSTSPHSYYDPSYPSYSEDKHRRAIHDAELVADAFALLLR